MKRTIPSENCKDFNHLIFSIKRSPMKINRPNETNIPTTLIKAKETNNTNKKLSCLNIIVLLTLGAVDFLDSLLISLDCLNDSIKDRSSNMNKTVDIATGKNPGPITPR